MTTKTKSLFIVLVFVFVTLSMSQSGTATHDIIGVGEGWLDSNDRLDLWNAGLAANYLGDTLKLVAYPANGLDIRICFALGLPTSKGLLRHELSCTDKRFRGGNETLIENITSSDFPNISWKFNALLIIEMRWVSGKGHYDFELSCC